MPRSVGRLAARLLVDHGDLIDDEEGVRMMVQATRDGFLQLLIRDRGLLTLNMNSVSFQGNLIENSASPEEGAPESIKWGINLLESVLKYQNATPMALQMELTWLLRDHSTPAVLVEKLGLVNALNGLFATSRYFEIRGDSKIDLPGLYNVESELTAGRLANYDDPENIGIQIKHWSPDNRFGETAPIDLSRPLVDRFFTTSVRVMEQQLEGLFPSGDVP